MHKDGEKNEKFKYRLPNYTYKFPHKANVLVEPQGSEEQRVSTTCVLYPGGIYTHQLNTHPMLLAFLKCLPCLTLPELCCLIQRWSINI